MRFIFNNDLLTNYWLLVNILWKLIKRNSISWLDFNFINMSIANVLLLEPFDAKLLEPLLPLLTLWWWSLSLEPSFLLLSLSLCPCPWGPSLECWWCSLRERFSDAGHINVGPKTMAKFWMCIRFSSDLDSTFNRWDNKYLSVSKWGFGSWWSSSFIPFNLCWNSFSPAKNGIKLILIQL